jgi:starch-binding outer membrane protein, SusD/RagB family
MPTARIRPLAVFLIALASACSRLTDVSAPDVVQRERLENANGAVTLWNGSVTTFYDNFNGPTTNFLGSFVALSGLVSDELTASFTNALLNAFDRLAMPEGGNNLRIDQSVLVTRIHLLQAIGALQRYAPTQRWRIGQAFALVGYTETLLAELMCSGVAVGNIVDFQPVMGTPHTTAQLYQRALADFDSALAYGTDSARVLNLARVGRARVLLDLNQPAAAASGVAAVPTTFVFNTEHTATVAPNYFFTIIASSRNATVADREGGNGLPFISAADPRVATARIGTGVDGITPVYNWTRVASTAVPTPLAGGIEARLIEAEAALRANPSDVSPTGSGWLGILNTLRATAITPVLAPLADPGTYDARVDLLFRERAFWLFGTGHRHGDMRRLVRQYSRALTTVFPTGAYKYGLTYGTDVTMPVDLSEVQYNPNMNGKGCIDRNP